MENKTYFSKKGFVIGSLLFLAMGFMLFALVSEATTGKIGWIEAVVTLAVLGFCLWMWFGTFYRFEDEFLLVCTGPLHWRVRYDRITKVEPSHSVLSSAALSFDRLAVYKDGRLSLLISPKDKQDFLQELRLHCPNAEIVGLTK